MSIPVVIAANGYGIPVKAVASRAPKLVVSPNGYGIPIVISDFGIPFVVDGLVAAAPVISGVPTISGTEEEGQTLSVTAASVTGSPTPTRSYQWERGGVAISGATSNTYTLVSADVGQTLTVVQTETNASGSDTAESAATGVIAAASDTTAPVINSMTFDEANDEIDLNFTEVNFPVTVYWQVRAKATAAPDQAAMIANTGSLEGGSYTEASSPASEAIDLSALADGDYTLYVMLKDPSDNYSAISDDDFTLTTPDTTAPVLTSPTDAANGATASTGSVSTDEGNGTLYWVVTTSATAPSAAQVKAGQDNGGTAATASGSQAVSATGVQNIAPSGLTASTAYTTHFMHEDAAANQSTVASASGFTTAAASSNLVTDAGLNDATVWDIVTGMTIDGSGLTVDGIADYNNCQTAFGKLFPVTAGTTVGFEFNVSSLTATGFVGMSLFFYDDINGTTLTGTEHGYVREIVLGNNDGYMAGVSVPAGTTHFRVRLQFQEADTVCVIDNVNVVYV